MAPLDDVLARIQAEAARGDMAIDVDVYRAAGVPPTQPLLLGTGSLDARVAVLGRDPGRHEVIEGEGFIGKGGQLIRQAFHRRLFARDATTTAEFLEAGRGVMWCNTVPYKPVGNKAWSVKVKRRFAPMIREVLVDHWAGHDVICCGNVAFDWFRLAQPELRDTLKEFWTRPDRYEASLTVVVAGKPLTLHPLPHPSPLNATWYKRFPELLEKRLAALDWGPDTWSV
jgi:uracil-DNA glycosylase